MRERVTVFGNTVLNGATIPSLLFLRPFKNEIRHNVDLKCHLIDEYGLTCSHS
jgi:hypothetical protein